MSDPHKDLELKNIKVGEHEVTEHEVDVDAPPVKETAPPPVPDFPEGGLAGWSTVAGALLVQFCAFGYTLSFGVYQDYYTTVFMTNETTSNISWIGGVNSSVTIFLGLLSGRLFDKGYFYHMVWGGAALDIVCLWLLCLAKPNHFYQNFLAQGLGAGIAQGMMYLPCIAVVSHYFRQRRALAMSIVASGSALGSFIQPILLNNLLNQHGYKTATMAIAALNTGVLVIACLLMRTRLPPPPSTLPFSTAVAKFSKDIPYVLTCLGLIIFSLGVYYPIFYIQLDAALHGVPEHLTFYILVILNVCSFFGRLVPGFLAPKLGLANLITFGMFGCSVLIFGMIGANSTASFVVIAILFGYCSGSFITLANPLLASFSTNQMEVGARMGIGFALTGIGALFCGPMEGAALGTKFEWWKPSVVSGTLAMVGVVCMLVMIVLVNQRKKQKAGGSPA